MKQLTGIRQLLGVDANSTPEEIKKAYKKISIKYHPDKNKTKEGEKMMKKITLAYDILTNIESMDEYVKKKKEEAREMQKNIQKKKKKTKNRKKK